MARTPTVETISVEKVLPTLVHPCTIARELIYFCNAEQFPFGENIVALECLLMGVCTNGEMRLTIDSTEFVVSKNNFFVVRIGHTIGRVSFSEDYQGHAVLGSQTFFHEMAKGMIEMSSLFMFLNTSPVRTFTDKEIEMFCNAMDVLRDHSYSLSGKYVVPFAVVVLRALCYDLFNSFAESGESLFKPAITRGEKVFYQFIKLIEENFRHERRVSWYAEQIGITPKYLSGLTKNVTNETPNAWIDKYVVMELRLLLHNRHLNIKEIAEIMHFPNQSFLGKYFKEHVGCSPSQYRKSI